MEYPTFDDIIEISESLSTLKKVKSDISFLYSKLQALEKQLLYTNYICHHFAIEELVYPKFFRTWGNRSWEFFDPRMLWTLDSIWEFYKHKLQKTPKVYVNNYIFGGKNQYRGIRPFNTTVGSKYSYHKFARAFDIEVDSVPSIEVFEDILNKDNIFFFRYIKAIKNYEWGNHIDNRNTNIDAIKILK